MLKNQIKKEKEKKKSWTDQLSFRVIVATCDNNPLALGVVYSTHIVPDPDEPTVDGKTDGSLARSNVYAEVWPLDIEPEPAAIVFDAPTMYVLDDSSVVTCDAPDGVGAPEGTTKNVTSLQDVPVLCPSVTYSTPLVQTGELHMNPELAMQVVPVKELLLKIPSEKSAASTIAIISIFLLPLCILGKELQALAVSCFSYRRLRLP